MFDRIQDSLSAENSVNRQMIIPLRIVLFAKQMRQSDSRPHREKATLKDIYLGLAQEGAALLLSGEIQEPQFAEQLRSANSSSTQILFPKTFYRVLEAIKQEADSGRYPVDKGYKISIISLAICLMREAIKYRQSKKTAPAAPLSV